MSSADFFRQPVSRLALGFLSCCFPGERIRAQQSRGTRFEGKSTAGTKKVRHFSSAALPAKSEGEPGPSDLQAFGLTTQSCLLPDIHPPNRTHGVCSPEDSLPATQVAPGPCTAVPPLPHPFILNISGKEESWRLPSPTVHK